MNTDLARLLQWLRRAQPPRKALWRALVAGLVASMTNVALFVGALALLVESAARPGLRAVVVVLVVIELFAFLRSPLRFVERLSAHRLGYAAVTRWRRWLVLVVGRLNFSQWRVYAAGDLLERALQDTDELQDLWLRFVVPFIDTAAVMLLGDVVIAVLPPYGRWWAYALVLFVVQVLGVVGLARYASAELFYDRRLRAARGFYRAELVELSAATPELVLLHREALAQQRSAASVAELESAESSLRRQRRKTNVLVLGAALLALAGVALHPTTSPVWLVVATAIGLATFDALNTIRTALHAAVEVSGGSERLEVLDTSPHRGSRSWPLDSTIRLNDVTLLEEDRLLVRDASFTWAPGSHVALTGESGVGKSTLLRALAGLDDANSGTISMGDVPLGDLCEEEFRQHVAYVMSEPGFTRGFAVDVVALGRTGTRDPHVDLAALGLTSERSTRFDELSRGERVRVAIARALVTRPDIYLLDEPTAGLGSEESARVLSLLDSTNATVVIATHDSDVIAWCDLVVALRDDGLLRVIR
ncbi:MAG TPA: ATP-binding cassette domain-containing protein [Acidimicrobiales bacterium]|nr:ATP-binding cassette domain-containing protein [Acidimicrobiales bacterium]